MAWRLDTKNAKTSDNRRAKIYELIEEIHTRWRKPSYEKMKDCSKMVEKLLAKEEYLRMEGEASPTFKAASGRHALRELFRFGQVAHVEVQAGQSEDIIKRSLMKT
ncbi:hypothetical protein ARMGADRAFT_1028512 [Armillaria gallica]|uniref:Uncharacterized protein n=1 Tax=Armillaria gallica TaxID=47427 RepID=A0A2H3DIP0_ARMGA|nr:hypothetical protein ARMGADRAFT_1028512 [Armillaria gallica]